MPRRPLLGNWFEEEAFEHDRKLLMKQRKGEGIDSNTGGEVTKILAKVRHHCISYPLSCFSPGGWLRFYSPVGLRSIRNGKILSVDLEDRQFVNTGWEISCTAASQADSQLRNTVILVPSPCPRKDAYPIPPDELDIVHYGQPFYILTLPELCENPLFLISESRSPMGIGSKITGKYQKTCFSPDGGGADAMWALDYWDPEYVEDMRDRPVKAESFYRVRHHMSATYLVCGDETLLTDFGQENEVGAALITPYASKRRAGPASDHSLWILMHRNQPLPKALDQFSNLRQPNGFLKAMGQPSQITDSEKAKRALLKQYYSSIISRMLPVYRRATAYLR